MEIQNSASKSKWTAKRLFRLGMLSFFISLLAVVMAVVLWWPLAFSWESDRLPIPAYIDVGVGVIGLIGGALSIVVMLVSGILLLFSHGQIST